MKTKEKKPVRAVPILLRKEYKFMASTIAVIGIILMLLSAALMSVITVRVEVPECIYGRMGDKIRHLFFSAYDIPVSVAESYSPVNVFGKKSGYTDDVEVTFGGKTLKYNDPVNTYNSFTTGADQGAVISANSPAKPYRTSVSEGKFPDKAGEALIGDKLAETLGAGVGDEINFGGKNFLVSGIYKYESFRYLVRVDGVVTPRFIFLLVVPEDTVLDKAVMYYTDGLEFMDKYKAVWKHYTVAIPDMIDSQIRNVQVAESFFSAIIGVLVLIVFFILYTLIATFYRRRRGQMCRLLTLGAGKGVVAGVYCLIVLLTLALAIAVGSGLSVVFNNYYMKLCSDIFGTVFPPRFYPALPFIVFAALSVAVLVIFGVFRLIISRASLAEEVKSE